MYKIVIADNVFQINRAVLQSFFLELVPPDIEKDVRNLYLALCELLGHFWKCFPPTSPSAEQKLVKMNEALQRFQTVKLKPFEVSIEIRKKYIYFSIDC